MYGVPGTGEADVRQESCFVFTSRGLSVAGRFREGFWWFGASQ